MSSQSSSTRPQPPVPPPPAPPRSAVNPLTLAIAAISAAVAAYVVSKIWEGGTLIATAMTPVIVALVREGLQKPVDRVTTLGTAPLPATRPRARATTPRGEAEPTVVQAPGADPTHAPVTVRRTGGRANRRWVRVGLVTGVVAFVIAAVVYTGTELVTGASSAGGDRASSLFGGTSHRSSSRRTRTRTTTTDTTSTTSTTPDAETTGTQATTPAATTPTVTVTTPAPAETTAVPGATTPAPDATATTPAQTTPAPTATTP